MKVLLATHHFPPIYKAGAEQYAYRLAHALQQRNHQVDVVCIESIHNGNLKPVHELDIYEGLPVYRLYTDLFRTGEPPSWEYKNPEIGNWFRNFLSEHRPDLVHINSGYLLTASVPQVVHEMGIPTVITLHDYWFLCPRVNLIRADRRICSEPVEAVRCAWCLLETKRRFREPDVLLNGHLGDAVSELGKIKVVAQITGLQAHIDNMEERRTFLKKILGNAQVVLCPSHFIIDKMREYGFPTHNLTYLPFGLEDSTQPDTKHSEISQKLRFGYLGQLTPHKGIHTLITAFNKLGVKSTEGELIIYGDLTREPNYVKRLREIASSNPSIIFAGPYTSQDLGGVLNSLDILVVPSEWFENRPTVILEAFAKHIPVIASNIGGIPELINNGENGLLFEAGNVQGLADQMRRLLKEPDLRISLRAGIRPVKGLSREIDELEAIYLKLLALETSYISGSKLDN